MRVGDNSFEFEEDLVSKVNDFLISNNIDGAVQSNAQMDQCLQTKDSNEFI